MLRKKPLDAAILSARALERMKKARMAMIMAQAFFGILALRLELVEDPTCETMWVDGVHLGYNPEYALEISEMECKGVICHEVLHVANRHHLRRGWREFEKWNRACDYAINLMVLAAGFMLPDGLLVDEKYRGMSAEMIYELLEDEDEDEGDDSSDDDQNQDGEQSDDPKGGSSGKKGDKQGEGDPSSGEGDASDSNASDGEGAEGDAGDDKDGEGAVGTPKKGKGAPGKKPRKKAPGEVRDCPPDVDKDKLANEWKSAIAHAADAQMMRGSAPGDVVEMIKGLRKSVLNWVDILWEHVEQIVEKQDYTWRTPHRNYCGIGLYLPSLVANALPGFNFYRDTSVSVPMEMIEQVHAEINAIKDNLRPECVRVVDADTRVTEVQELGPDDELKLEVKGRGGTDLRAPYEWSEKEGIDPLFAIHMTDLDGPLPDKDPGYPVIFLTPPGAPKPPFGIQIEMQY